MAQKRPGQRPNDNKNKKKGGDKKSHEQALSPFLEPLTRKTLKQELRTESRLALRPQQRELQGEVRAEKAYRPRIRDYFQTYGTAVDKAADSTSAAYGEAVARSQAAGASAAAVDQTARDRIEAAAAEDARLRGATYTPSATSAAGSANRADSAGLLSTVIAGQGANQAAYLADKARIGKGELRDQLLRSHARSRSLDSDKRALALAKRDFAKDYIARARESERSFSLSQQQLAQTARGQKISAKTSRKNAALSAQTSQANAALSAATTRRGQDMTAANAAASRAQEARQERYDRRHPSESTSAPEDKTDREDVQQASALLRSLKPEAVAKMSQQQILDAITTKDQTISRREALLAYQRFVKANAPPPPRGL